MYVRKVNQIGSGPYENRDEIGFVEPADLSNDTKGYIWPDCATAIYFSAPGGSPTQAAIVPLTANTWAQVDYEQEERCNSGVTWQGGGSPGPWGFVPPVEGVWGFNAMVELTLPGGWAACDLSLGLFKNGSLYKLFDRITTGTTGKVLLQGSGRGISDGATDVYTVMIRSTVGQPSAGTWSGYVDAAFDSFGVCGACIP